MFFKPSKTALFQMLRTLPLGKATFNELIKLNQKIKGQGFYPRIVSLKPKYCESLLYFKRNYRNESGFFSHDAIMRLCDFTLNMAMESQAAVIINPQPQKVTLDILKETRAQISAICDWQDQATGDFITINVQDVEGDAIAVTRYYF